MLEWLKARLVELGVRLEYREESHIIQVNDRRRVHVDWQYSGKVEVSISDLSATSDRMEGLCGIGIDRDGVISFVGKHYATVGLLETSNNRVIPWDVEKKPCYCPAGCGEHRKTFHELVEDGEWDQARYNHFADKYALRLTDPIRKELEKGMPKDSLIQITFIQMLASNIIRHFLMELYHDASLATEEEKAVMEAAVMECRRILLEETSKLEVIAHSEGIPEEHHSGIERVSTTLLDILGSFREALGIRDWTELDSKYIKEVPG